MRPFLLALVISLITATTHAAITILPLGDSLTAGYDGAPSAGYRQHLLNDLTTQGITIQYQGVFDPTLDHPGVLGSSTALTAIGQNLITAFGGYRSADILNNLNGDAPSPNLPTTGTFTDNKGGFWMTGGNGTGRSAVNPNIVLLMMGSNDPIDAYTAALTPTQTDANIASTLNWFSANRPNSIVLIASPPPAIAAGSPLYVQQVAAATPAEKVWLKNNITIANFPNARYVDVFDSFLNTDGSIRANLFSSDGLHPNDAGYALIASTFDSAIVAAVPETKSILVLSLLFLIFSQRRSQRSV